MNSSCKYARVRPQFQRAFFKWLSENRQRFLIPLIIQKRTDKFISFRFSGVNSAITARLNNCGLDVNVVAELKEETFWDLLVSIDAYLSATQGGYCDKFFLPEYQKVYPSREAFWIAELFELFLDWVNNELANAKWLALYRWGGISEATLLRDERMQERHGQRVFSILGELRSLDGVAMKDVISPEDMERCLLPVRV